MAIGNASDVSKKWANNLSQAGTSIKNGIQNVQTAPTQLAARRQDAYAQGVARAVASGKWARGLNRVSLQDWQNAAINKGIPRIASGAANAQPKMESFMNQWLPYMQQLQSKLQSMPRGDTESNRARMNAAFDHNRAFVRQ